MGALARAPRAITATRQRERSALLGLAICLVLAGDAVSQEVILQSAPVAESEAESEGISPAAVLAADDACLSISAGYDPEGGQCGFSLRQLRGERRTSGGAATALGLEETTIAAVAKKCFQANQYWIGQAGHVSLPWAPRSVEASVSACQQRCLRVSGCAHFSFWPDGGCLLTGSGASPKSHSGVIAGPPHCKVAAPAPASVAGAPPPPLGPAGVRGACRPGFVSGDDGCVRPSEPPLMTFYAYRSVDDTNIPLNEGLNMASIGGAMFYLHNEVIGHCPRKFGVTRILRYLITMKATPELYQDVTNPTWGGKPRGGKRDFGLFLQFDSAKCTNPSCSEMFRNYGYIPGCTENPQSTATYAGAKWYSFPGQCPFQDFRSKGDFCRRQEPGGFCTHPDGTRTCTYSLQYEGEVSLEELTGISDYNHWCRARGHSEFDLNADRGWGPGAGFWDGKHDAAKCASRIAALQALFASKYPDRPVDLGEPVCDGTWFEGHPPEE
mmetsp:Transcript_132333/g.295948  ORF Transcript_132333/g.295948 Transcript_132333/m.295948 type:complete len:497 (+) Transcript_132333:108-1598(+)